MVSPAPPAVTTSGGATASDTPSSEWSTSENAPSLAQSNIRRIGGGGTMSIPRGRGLDKLVPHMAGMSLGEHREGRSRGSALQEDTRSRMVDPTRVNFREAGTEKKGTSGELLPLIANYVRVLSTPQWLLYQYHVTFSPDSIDSRRTRRELIGNVQSMSSMTLNFCLCLAMFQLNTRVFCRTLPSMDKLCIPSMI